MLPITYRIRNREKTHFLARIDYTSIEFQGSRSGLELGNRQTQRCDHDGLAAQNLTSSFKPKGHNNIMMHSLCSI